MKSKQFEKFVKECIVELLEASQPEPHDPETDTFQPSPRERTGEHGNIPSPSQIEKTIRSIYGNQPSIQDIVDYFSREYGEQAPSKFVKLMVRQFMSNPNFFTVLNRNTKPVKEANANDKFLSGMKKDSARPVGAKIFDATVSVSGNELRIETPKGHWTIILTPEQIEQAKAESGNLDEGKYASLALAGLLGLAGVKAIPQTPVPTQSNRPRIHMPDPTKELPSEEDMDSWDLADKYSASKERTAKALEPMVKKYFGKTSMKEVVKECVVSVLKERLMEGFDPQSSGGPNATVNDPSFYDRMNSKMQKMEEEGDHGRYAQLAGAGQFDQRTFQEIRDTEDPDGTKHDLALHCIKCGTKHTCKCSKPKRRFNGICPDCE